MSVQIEIIGLALGVFTAIPPAVAALQFCGKELSFMIYAKDEILKIEREFREEQNRLETTCRNFLYGIVPTTKIQQLIEDPGGAEWKSYDQELRLRLWHADETTRSAVSQAYEATKELRKKLAIDDEGKIELTTRASIINGALNGLHFTLRRKSYTTILEKIRSANEKLERLTSDNGISGESAKRGTSETTLMPILRGLYNDIFKAVAQAAACSCEHSHSICLELSHRRKIILRNELDEENVLALDMHVAFGSGKPPRSDRATNYQGQGSGALSRPSWTSFRVKRHSCEGENGDKREKDPVSTKTKPRTVHWEPIESTASTTRPSADNGEESAMELYEGPAIYEELCHVVTKSQKQKAVDCYGLVGTQGRKFEIRSRLDADICRASSLLAILEDDYANSSLHPKISLETKLRIAIDISTAFMYLSGTPWLREQPTLGDFVLLVNQVQDASTGQTPDTMSQTFVGQHVRRDLSQDDCKSGSITQLENPNLARLAFLRCGALLTQILLGKLICALEDTTTMDESTIREVCEMGLKEATQIQTKAGDQCRKAVEWCFSRAMNADPSLNIEQWIVFHGQVVQRFEGELKSYQGIGEMC